MKLQKIHKRNILNTLPEPVEYSPTVFGVKGALSGKNTKISIIGTGLPVHKDFNKESRNFADFDTLIENTTCPYDQLGHSTILAGFLCGQSSSIKGMATKATIYNIKAFDQTLKTDVSTITAAILWSLIKDVDIIVIPCELDFTYRPLCDAIKKVNDNGVFILISSSDWQEKYPITIPIKGSKRKNPFKLIKSYAPDKYIRVAVPLKSCLSLYGKSLYVKSSIELTSLGLATGIFSALIEKNKKNMKKKYNKIDFAIQIVNDIKNISVK